MSLRFSSPNPTRLFRVVPGRYFFWLGPLFMSIECVSRFLRSHDAGDLLKNWKTVSNRAPFDPTSQDPLRQYLTQSVFMWAGTPSCCFHALSNLYSFISCVRILYARVAFGFACGPADLNPEAVSIMQSFQSRSRGSPFPVDSTWRSAAFRNIEYARLNLHVR